MSKHTVRTRCCLAVWLLVVGLLLWSGRVQAASFIVGIEVGGGDLSTDIVTYDFATGAVVSFSPNAALGCSGLNNGRGVAVLGNEIFYTYLTCEFGPSDAIHVVPFNQGAGNGDGGSDLRTLANPRPAAGILALAIAGGALYALTGSQESPPAVTTLQVFKLDPTTGQVLSPPVTIGGVDPSVVGFTVLPNGNFLVQAAPFSATYREFDAVTGAPTGGAVTVQGVGNFLLGVTTDGVSLFFSNGGGFVRTDLQGQVIAQRSFAQNIAGLGFVGAPLPLPLPLPTPPAFSAIPTAPGEVTLTITPVTGATVYNIYRAADPVVSEPQFPFFNPYAILLPGAPRVATISGTAWVDGPLQPLVRYYYAVTAVNAQGESFPTGQQVTATAAPDAPIIGFADPHVHQFSHLGFGGLLVHGEPFSADGDIGTALPWCSERVSICARDLGGPCLPPNCLPVIIDTDKTCPVCPFALPTSCVSVSKHGLGGDGDLIGNTLRFIETGDPVALLGHLVGGNPQFDGWPRWDSVTHQQAYYEWLERAYQGGLRLMVMLAVNNETFCTLANRQTGFGCNDMDAVDRQLQAAKDLQNFIDGLHGGPGKGWYQIAYSGRQARHIINSGKLAVVLGVEVPSLFNCHKNDQSCDGAHVQTELQRYYDLGLRHVFPVHNADNRFGGTALYIDKFNFNNLHITGDYWDVGNCPDATEPVADQVDFHLELFDVLNNEVFPGAIPGILSQLYPGQAALIQALLALVPALPNKPPPGPNCNLRDLTDVGRELINQLMNHHMMIDVDHMSARMLNEVLTIAEQRQYPALVMGHTGFIATNNPRVPGVVNKKSEANKTATQVTRLRDLGGLVSVILHQGTVKEIAQYPSRTTGTTVPNDCGTSSKTWAQAYLYAVDQMRGGPQGGAVAIGSDVMGFIATAAPRFDGDPFSHACNNDPKPPGNQGAGIAYPIQIHNQPGHLGPMQIGEREFNLNTDGFANIGLYPDFIADLNAIGLTDADLAPLFSSAEAYVRMWEKAENTPPVAKSKNVTVAAGPTCSASASIDNGSFDPDGDPLTITQSPPGPYGLGTTVVTLTVTDSFGASSTSQATVTVVDTTAPTLVCPANSVVAATSMAGAVVPYPAPTATDNCPAVRVTCAPASGATFAIGTTPVPCTATDQGNNQASCTFTVKVKSAAEQTTDLMALVTSDQLAPGTATSLLAKLQAALTVLQGNDTATACGTLTAFLHEVNAQSGKHITASQAMQLVAAAQQIKTVVGCP